MPLISAYNDVPAGAGRDVVVLISAKNEYLRGDMRILERQISTDIFRTGSAPHAKAAAEEITGRWRWAALMALAAIAAYGCFWDIRWLIVAVAITLLVIPALALFGYMHAIGDEDAVAAVSPRKAVFDTDGSIIVTQMPTVPDGDAPAPRVPAPVTIGREEIDSIEFRGRLLDRIFQNGERRLMIPLDAFKDPSEPSILADAFGRPAVNS